MFPVERVPPPCISSTTEKPLFRSTQWASFGPGGGLAQQFNNKDVRKVHRRPRHCRSKTTNSVSSNGLRCDLPSAADNYYHTILFFIRFLFPFCSFHFLFYFRFLVERTHRREVKEWPYYFFYTLSRRIPLSNYRLEYWFQQEITSFRPYLLFGSYTLCN